MYRPPRTLHRPWGRIASICVLGSATPVVRCRECGSRSSAPCAPGNHDHGVELHTIAHRDHHVPLDESAAAVTASKCAGTSGVNGGVCANASEVTEAKARIMGEWLAGEVAWRHSIAASLRSSRRCACNRRDPRARPIPRALQVRLDDRRARDWSCDYLMARMNTSAGFWPLFFDSCFTPRPMNSASPAFQLVLAGFPSRLQ